MNRPIRLFTDSILHQPTEFITDFTDSSLQELAQDMIETMQKNNGIGLAANQIGVNKNICVMNLENKTKLMVLVNLKILRYSKEKSVEIEGCLSVPGISVKVKRPLVVEAEGQTLTGEKVAFRFEGYDARIFMHEYSHLQGQIISNDIKNIVKNKHV